MGRKKLHKLSEAFDILPFTPQTIRVYAVQGRIPCYKIGRRFFVDLDEIREFVKSITLRVGGEYVNQSECNQ